MDEQEDVTIDPETGEEIEEGNPEQKIAKMRGELSVCRKEKQEYMDRWQTAKADYVNALKRFETETTNAELKGKVKAVETLFPAFDALERAKEHGDIPEGFQAIIKQLESAFTSLGLTEVETKSFDPALHEALGIDQTKDKDADKSVTAVLERGWRIDDKIIRPAKVRVAQYNSGE